MTDPTKPLAGTRVLDLTNVLAGPFACHQLVHLGAEVIKVEAPGRGDLARNLGLDPTLSARGMGISFLAQNAGKQSITLNLKIPRGKDALKRLVATADVLIENFRPGVMERLNLGPDVLRAENPGLIYCAISGFGQDGPWANRPAYDQIVQGVSGVMSITGDADSAPLRVGYPLADTVGGLTAAMAICAALQADPRGCVIDVSMLESVLATMGWVVSNHLIGGVTPAPHGNENPTSAPSGAFQCADGLLNIAANRDEQWETLARHLGRADLLDRADYATREDRKANRLTLKAELETVLTTRPAEDWAEELNAIGVPAGAVMSLPDILSHPQVADRDFLARFEDAPGVDRAIDLMRIGAQIDGQRPKVDSPPPVLGKDTQAILKGLGYTLDEIADMAKKGVT
ncbi:Crotonobetainyl-CoA:carnitine CoA-transferase [Rhodobacteraceae bacterium THAF1]|uniref:CaiB/BaiF CoA transferase family protein n=1 Tax=Palleronia sp. THAF1 TaxID=2587842 RepID=UPI000F400280|nr:CoA transferase [Palleronia sp. THAF1]QFU09702.1 Crotonobetainyl-CoA:carnitine CoA-transferase [Palleronia sp. THAF1]VDC17395.1 Crotonobetainyl-CoA:carnitine CoA-transferase [Rhodobacteraceae bacterium THAF1]